ncbi:MAG: TonB-dependent siderophore receptor [Opitutales bacterium]
MSSRRNLTVVAACAAFAVGYTQEASPSGKAEDTSAAPTSDHVFELPSFQVNSEKDTSLVGKTALSSTRIAVDLSEVPQSINVLNHAFIKALNVDMASDMLQYVGGGQNGQLNWTAGRMNIRGFTGDADYIDGFAPPAATALDESIFDRFEVVKGPSAIFLAADGSPGGIMSKISKSPQSKPMTEVSFQTGIFNGNHLGLDSTGPLTKDGKLTYRVVLGESYNDGYYKNVYMHRFTSMGALSYAFSPNTKLTVKAESSQVNWPSYNGIPIDPRTLQMMALPHDATQDFNTPLDWRMDSVHRVWADFQSRLNNYLAVSIRGMRAFDRADRHESIAPTWSEGTTTGTALINGTPTSVTFLGGKWVTPSTVGTGESVAPTNYYTQNGKIYVVDSWAGAPTYAGGAVPRSTINADDGHIAYNDVMADLNFNYSGKHFTELLLLGFEHRDQPSSTETWKTGVSASPWYPFGGEPAGSTVVNYTTPSAYTQLQSKQDRGYALETLKLWDDRIIPSFGVSRASTMAGTFNALTKVYTHYNLNANLVQWGLVVKVMKGVSLFTGFNQNFAVNGTGTLNGVTGAIFPPKTGKQHEVGVKTEWLNGRFTLNISYFDIQQQNNTVPSFPLDPLNPNVLIPGIISRGWDGDWTFKASSKLYLMGSFASYNAKSILGATYAGAEGSKFIQPGLGTVAWASIPVDNTAQETASIYGMYKYSSSFEFGLGANYQSKRAITDGPNQVFWGYVPGRTVLNGTATYYYNKHLRYTLTVDNLLNKSYIYSVRSEDVIVPGSPFNIKLGMAYTF